MALLAAQQQRMLAANLAPRSAARRLLWVASAGSNGINGGAPLGAPVAPSEVPMVKVRFHIPYVTAVGEDLAVVGAGDFLGSWQVDRSIPLRWQEGHEWVGDLDVPCGATLEYKYIVVRGNGTVEWSPGSNILLEAAAKPGCTMDVHECWICDDTATQRRIVSAGPQHAAGKHASGAGSRSGASGGTTALGGNGAALAQGALESARAAANAVVSAVSRLQGATERLARVEWEAAVVGLLYQNSLMTAERIHQALQDTRPRLDLDLDSLHSLLSQMVCDEKLVVLYGEYRLHASSRFASAGQAPALAPPPFLAPPAPRGSSRSSGSASGAPAQDKPPQQQQQQYGMGGGGEEHAAATAPSKVQLAQAVMRLLEAYSSMSLDRMLRALSSGAGPAEVRGVTGEQLRHVLAQLTADGRVVQATGGLYRKGVATPSPSRRAATPMAARRLAPTPPSPWPPPAHRELPSPEPSTPTAPLRLPMSSSQLEGYEQRAMASLSNYLGCTAERIHMQLTSSCDFPGTPQDTLRMLRSLAGEGRVREAPDGTFSYLSTRQATPPNARGRGGGGSGNGPCALPMGPRSGATPAPSSLRSSFYAAPAGGASSSSSSLSSSSLRTSSRSGGAPLPARARSAPSPSPGRRAVSTGALAGVATGVRSRIVVSASSTHSTGGLAGTSSAHGAAATKATAAAAAAVVAEAAAPTGLRHSVGVGVVAGSRLSAFSLFCAQRKEAVRVALPKAGVNQVRQVLAAEWILAPEQLRHHFFEQAAAARLC